MEIVILLVVLALAVVVGVGVVALRPRRDADLEPPPPTAERQAPGTAPVDDDLVAEVEEALGTVRDEAARAPAPEAPAPEAPVRPRFRDRLAKAAGRWAAI